MLLTLCSCSEKVKPEKIDTKNYSRETQLEGSGVEIIHADKTTQEAQDGLLLNSDDSLRVDAGGVLIVNVDGRQQVFGRE